MKSYEFYAIFMIIFTLKMTHFMLFYDFMLAGTPEIMNRK